MPELFVKDITKTFRGAKILDGVTFRVKSGEVMVLLGPSGAGKTTLLRIIAGTESPDSGKIYIDGEDITEKPPKDREVGMVFQTFALYPHLTVFENIASPLRVKKVPEDEIRRRVNEVAGLLGITHVLHKRPQECSGGEAQRVVIARALVKNPRICLFDEPLTNLDYKVREVLRIELKRIFRELGMTVIYATPNPEEAAALGTSLVHIRNGKIIQTGSIKECFRYPRDVEAFANYSPYGVNVLEAKCVREDGKRVLRVNTLLSIDVSAVGEIIEGGEYLVGIYPHDILSEDLVGTTCLRIPVNVDLIENTGSELIIDAKVGDNIIRMVSHDVEKLAQLYRLQYVYIPLDRVIIFRKSDGLRICNLR